MPWTPEELCTYAQSSRDPEPMTPSSLSRLDRGLFVGQVLGGILFAFVYLSSNLQAFVFLTPPTLQDYLLGATGALLLILRPGLLVLVRPSAGVQVEQPAGSGCSRSAGQRGREP